VDNLKLRYVRLDVVLSVSVWTTYIVEVYNLRLITYTSIRTQ
jgi:hypothetical protein